MARGIRDKVGHSRHGLFEIRRALDRNAEDLMVEAFEECMQDAGIERKQIEAAWFGTAIEEQHVGNPACRWR